MRDYRHMMEQVTLSDQKKEEIMDMIEHKNTGKRRLTKKAGAVVLAAALAVGCVLSIAAGLPARVYNFVAGGSTTVLPGTDQVFFEGGYTGAEEGSPVTVENDRLWLEVDGQKMDVTDKVDENTPYIYERTDPATGEKGYVIVGGTVDDFGWAELIQMEDTAAISGSNFAEPGKLELMEPVGMEDEVFVADEANGDACQIVEEGAYRPWFQAALDQIGLVW